MSIAARWGSTEKDSSVVLELKENSKNKNTVQPHKSDTSNCDTYSNSNILFDLTKMSLFGYENRSTGFCTWDFFGIF